MQNKHSTILSETLQKTAEDIAIPPRPAILDKICSEISKSDPDFKALESLITADVSLAAGLIKIANSPYFGYGRRVRSPREAILSLGLNATSRAIAGICLRNAFPATPKLERFWSSSSQIATLSGWLVQKLRIPRISADDAYTFGLFRDCGIPVMALRYSAYFETLRLANNESIRSFTDIELMSFPTEHAVVGALLTQNWWLPDEICEAIRSHHDVLALCKDGWGSPGATDLLIALSQTAEYLVQRHTGQCHTCEWEKMRDACLEILKLTQADLKTIVDDSQAVLKSVV